jgi:hypothetical protein
VPHAVFGERAKSTGARRDLLPGKPMISALAPVLKCRLKPTTAADVSAATLSLSTFTAEHCEQVAMRMVRDDLFNMGCKTCDCVKQGSDFVIQSPPGDYRPKSYGRSKEDSNGFCLMADFVAEVC